MSNQTTLETRLKEIWKIHAEPRKCVDRISHVEMYIVANGLNKLYDIAVQQAKEISDFRISLTDVLKVADSREKQIDELKADIDRLTRFIPVGERVPDHFREVLVECDISGTKMHKTASHYGDNRWDVDNVTGWREI